MFCYHRKFGEKAHKSINPCTLSAFFRREHQCPHIRCKLSVSLCTADDPTTSLRSPGKISTFLNNTVSIILEDMWIHSFVHSSKNTATSLHHFITLSHLGMIRATSILLAPQSSQKYVTRTELEEILKQDI